MKLLQRILVPVDFGSQTESVIDAATCLARKFDSEVSLIHVLPEVKSFVQQSEEVMQLAKQGAKAELSELHKRLADSGVSASEDVIAAGVPFEQIMAHADDIDANVIVVGSSREENASRDRIGTTAERLCRRANKPVWVVNAEAQMPPQNILCAVDGSAPSERALRNAIHLARRFEATLKVLHAIRPHFGFSARLTSDQPDLTEAEASLARFLDGFDFHGVQWEGVVTEGAPADSIIGAALESSTDLIVMGSVGRTGLSEILLGGVASKVTRDLPCSVVVMKAEEAIRLKVDQELGDLNANLARGRELLENGFADEARRQFEQCIKACRTFAPAWEALADAAERLGDESRADECRATAQQIREAFEWRRIEGEIRRSHPLWGKKGDWQI